MEIKTELFADSRMWCRVCESSEVLLNIFGSAEDDIPNKIRSCASVQVSQDDGLPQHICEQCIADLETAYLFRKRCEATDSKLRTALNVKHEVPNIDDSIQELIYELVDNDPESDSPLDPPDCQLEPKEENDTNNSSDFFPDEAAKPKEKKHSKEPSIYTCESCGEEVTSMKKLRAHMRSHTKEEPSTRAQKLKEDPDQRDSKKFTCEECSLVFKCLSAQRRHISAVHEKRRDYICKICGEGFALKYGLRSHQTVHKEARFPCSKCPSTFKWKRSLVHHEQLHLPVEERDPKLLKKYFPSKKKYICSFCGKISNNISCHTVHERYHTDERPYPCVLCDKKFRTSTQLRKHIAIHEGTKAYKCEICDKSFRQKSHLVTHNLTHTLEKNHVCQICSKAFSLKASLKSHMKSHELFEESKQ